MNEDDLLSKHEKQLRVNLTQFNSIFNTSYSEEEDTTAVVYGCVVNVCDLDGNQLEREEFIRLCSIDGVENIVVMGKIGESKSLAHVMEKLYKHSKENIIGGLRCIVAKLPSHFDSYLVEGLLLMSALDEYARGEQRRIIVDGLGLDELFVRFDDIPGCSVHKGYLDKRITKHTLNSSSVPGDGIYYGLAYSFSDTAMTEVRSWLNSNPSTAVKGVLELLFMSYNLGISGGGYSSYQKRIIDHLVHMLSPGPFKKFVVFGKNLGPVETYVKKSQEFSNHFAKEICGDNKVGHPVGEWFTEVDGVEFGAVKDKIVKYMGDNNLLSDRDTIVSNHFFPNLVRFRICSSYLAIIGMHVYKTTPPEQVMKTFSCIVKNESLHKHVLSLTDAKLLSMEKFVNAEAEVQLKYLQDSSFRKDIKSARDVNEIIVKTYGHIVPYEKEDYDQYDTPYYRNKYGIDDEQSDEGKIALLAYAHFIENHYSDE